MPALLEHGGVACLPGTHSKWVRVEPGRIAGFATHLTGEAFSALRGHTILGRTMRDGPMSIEQIVRIGIQIASGLQAAH